MKYKTTTATDERSFKEKLNAYAKEGFELDKFTIHPIDGRYIGILINKSEYKSCETCQYWTRDCNIDPNCLFGECEHLGIQGAYFYCKNFEAKE